MFLHVHEPERGATNCWSYIASKASHAGGQLAPCMCFQLWPHPVAHFTWYNLI